MLYIYIHVIYIYIYIYMLYIYMCVCVVKKTDNVPSRLLPIRQWPHGSSCTRAHTHIYIYIIYITCI